jgi:membrane-associated phospholipid phosphatase
MQAMTPGVSQLIEGSADYAIAGALLVLILVLLWLWRWSLRHEGAIKSAWKRLVRAPRVELLRERFRPQLAFVRARLSPHGYFGLQITLGAAALIGASWLFGGISEDVLTGDPLTIVDENVAAWFHARAASPVTWTMQVVSNLHGVVAISSYVTLLALYLLRKRDWYWLLCMALTVPGGMLINESMKHVFQRARPHLEQPLLTLPSFSFPSGHVAGTALFYGVLGAMLIARIKIWRWRVFVVLAVIALVILVALSRVYLGVHYFSDVVAAFAEAVAWLSLCLMGTHTYFRLRAEGLRKENFNVST